MPEEVRGWVMQWFNIYKLTCGYMIKHRIISNRRTLLSYNYVYRQFMAWHDHWYNTDWEPTHRWWFNIIKTPKRLAQCEDNMRLIIDYLNKNKVYHLTIPFIPLT